MTDLRPDGPDRPIRPARSVTLKARGLTDYGRRFGLGVFTTHDLRQAAKVLTQLAACKERGGELRKLYEHVAAMLADEIDHLGQITPGPSVVDPGGERTGR